MPRVALASVLACAALAAWTDGDVGIDHVGADIKSFTLPSNSTADCSAACDAVSPAGSCMAWVLTPSGRCGVNATCWLKSSVGAPVVNDCRISGFSAAGGALLPVAFTTLPLGSLVPGGWLAAELAVCASGLTGYLSEFWPDIQNSTYVGGSADGGLHERAPYWLNGLVPLSYLTSDAHLAAQRDTYLQYIMDHAAPSGWLGPDDMPKDGNQYWSRMNVVLALEQYYEGSGDARAITTIFNYLGEARRRMLGATQLGGWAVSRAQDFIWAMQWLMDNLATLKGVPAGYNEAFLLDFMDITREQCLANGGDWKSFFDVKGEMPEGPACTGGARCDMYTHGVNIGQALKSEAVWYRRRCVNIFALRHWQKSYPETTPSTVNSPPSFPQRRPHRRRVHLYPPGKAGHVPRRAFGDVPGRRALGGEDPQSWHRDLRRRRGGRVPRRVGGHPRRRQPV